MNNNISSYAKESIVLMASLIRTARIEQRISTTELAERSGISRSLLQRIEKGDTKCSIGAVFEVATIVGVRLFDANESSITKHIRQVEDKLALLPKSVYQKKCIIDDNF